MGRNASAHDGETDINIGAYGEVYGDDESLYRAGEHGERPR